MEAWTGPEPAEEEEKAEDAAALRAVAESARAHNDILSPEVQKTCEFCLSPFWL